MDRQHYQACYTRIGRVSSKHVNSEISVSKGYQSVHCFPDMPYGMRQTFEKRMRIDSPRPGSIYDIRDQMLEIMSEGGFAGIGQVRYDAVDDDGREVFFAQMFLFTDAYEFLKTPEKLLRIDDTNFGTNIEQNDDIQKVRMEREGVICWCLDHTSSEPKKLVLAEEMSMESALAYCGMTYETYYKFVVCVYQQAFFSSARTSIYIRTDGDREKMRQLLYLLYITLPYSMREKISAAEFTVKNQTGSLLLFCIEVPARQKYVDPVTGENNVMGKDTEQNLRERAPYLEYVFRLNMKERTEYFDAMEVWLEERGKSQSSQTELLRLAHQMITRQQKDVRNIPGLLYDCLNACTLSNEKWEQDINGLLQTVAAENLSLPPAVDSILKAKMKTTASEKLEKTYLDYQASVVKSMSAEEAANYLIFVGKKSAVYGELRRRLSADEKGQCILHRACMILAEEAITQPALTYREILEIYEETRMLKNANDVLEILDTLAYQIALKQQESGEQHYRNIYNEYSNVVLKMHGNIETRNYQINYRCLMNAYDRKCRTHLLKPKLLSGEYSEFYRDYGSFLENREGETYIQVLIDIHAGKYAQVIAYLKDEQRSISFVMLEQIEDTMICEDKKKKNVPLAVWIAYADRIKEKLEYLLIDAKASVLYDAELLKESLIRDDYWKNTFAVERQITAIEDRLQEESGNENTLEMSLEILTEEEKRRKKQIKQREKEERSLIKQEKFGRLKKK